MIKEKVRKEGNYVQGNYGPNMGQSLCVRTESQFARRIL